jgi:hypothetical protein
MKKLLGLCSALLALAASNAFAGVDMTWNDCVLESQVQDINFTNCTAVSNAKINLFVEFKTATPAPNFVAAHTEYFVHQDGVAALSPFWRFDDTASGGCNSAKLSVFVNADQLGKCALENPDGLWDASGAGGNVTPFAYIPSDNGNPAHGELITEVSRVGVFAIAANTNYYLQNVQITSGSNACLGCDGQVEISLNRLVLAAITGPANDVIVTGPDTGKLAAEVITGGDCASINGGSCQGVVPVKKSTWAQLKSLYR